MVTIFQINQSLKTKKGLEMTLGKGWGVRQSIGEEFYQDKNVLLIFTTTQWFIKILYQCLHPLIPISPR